MREMLTDTGDGFLRSGRVRFHRALAPLMVPIDSVEPSPFNYNNGDVERIIESIQAVGMYRPVQVQASTGLITSGNHTWTACKEMGAEYIPVIAAEWSDDDAKRQMVGDNEIARLAIPDKGLLLALLNELPDPAIGTGLTEGDIETLRLLDQIPLDTDEYGSWPTFTVRLPPHVLRGLMFMTHAAGDDRARIELLLRMAGWEG